MQRQGWQQKKWRQEDILVTTTFTELAPYNDMANVRSVAEWRVYEGSKSYPADESAYGAEFVWVWKYGGPAEDDVVVGKVPKFSESIEAAWRIVEVLRTRGYYVDVSTLADCYEVVVRGSLGEVVAVERNASLALAICRAALVSAGVLLPA